MDHGFIAFITISEFSVQEREEVNISMYLAGLPFHFLYSPHKCIFQDCLYALPPICQISKLWIVTFFLAWEWDITNGEGKYCHLNICIQHKIMSGRYNMNLSSKKQLFSTIIPDVLHYHKMVMSVPESKFHLMLVFWGSPVFPSMERARERISLPPWYLY